MAWVVYSARLLKSEEISRAVEPFPEILENKYYLDYSI